MSEIKKKSKIRLNVIDVMIILLVIALIATVVYRIYTGVNEKTSGATSKYVMTFECDSEYRSMLDYLTTGKAVYFAHDGKLLGHLYDPNKDDSVGAVYEATDIEVTSVGTGDYKKTKLCGQLRMSAETISVKTGGYYAIGERNVTVGSKIEVYTNEAIFTLTVREITTVG